MNRIVATAAVALTLVVGQPALANAAERSRASGIAETIKSKVTRPESDIVSELVARGEVELGMVVITSCSRGRSRLNSRAPEAARELMKFLTGATAAPVIRAQGMEPAL